MRPSNVIRYYRHFRKGPKPAAIPVLEARYPCITHPFATKLAQVLPPKQAPSDLHALATPPAFVLSQDQTLQVYIVAPGKNRSPHPVSFDKSNGLIYL